MASYYLYSGERWSVWASYLVTGVEMAILISQVAYYDYILVRIARRNNARLQAEKEILKQVL
jgi:hypothetical protein